MPRLLRTTIHRDIRFARFRVRNRRVPTLWTSGTVGAAGHGCRRCVRGVRRAPVVSEWRQLARSHYVSPRFPRGTTMSWITINDNIISLKMIHAAMVVTHCARPDGPWARCWKCKRLWDRDKHLIDLLHSTPSQVQYLK